MTATDTATRTFTAYAAAKLVNTELEVMGLPTIPAQMIYNYVGKGTIPSIKGTDGKKVVAETELAKWFAGYVQRKANKAQRVMQAAAATVTVEVDENQTALF